MGFCDIIILYFVIRRNFMKILVLIIQAVICIYNLILSFVELRSAGNPTPENVSDIYDAETYEKWKRYSGEHCRQRIVFGFIAMAATLALLYFDAYSAFASFFPAGAFWQMISVILLTVGVDFIIEIPQSYISNMIIEQKYGFNRTNMKTFIADRIRSLILGIILNLILSGIVAVCHVWLGNFMAILCAVALVGFSLLITFLYPFISRIGNKFTPLEEGDLRTNLEELLTKHGYTVRAIEVMDASRRTTKMNAYFTGFGKMKTIVLYDNLVNAMTPDEICAVFAHELGHGIHKDTLKLQIVNMLNFVLISLLAWGAVSYEPFYTEFGFEGLNYGFAFLLINVGLGILTPFIGIMTNAMSRRFEYSADRQAVAEGYGEAMIPALKKLAKDNFAHLSPSPLYVILEYSHPPIDKRIAAIERELNKK